VSSGHRNALSGQIRRVFGTEERHHRSDLFGRTDSLQWHHSLDLLQSVRVRPKRLAELGPDDAGTHAVDAHLERRQLVGHGFGQTQQSGLGDGIGADEREGLKSAD